MHADNDHTQQKELKPIKTTNVLCCCIYHIENIQMHDMSSIMHVEPAEYYSQPPQRRATLCM